jgi:hypothetical protein
MSKLNLLVLLTLGIAGFGVHAHATQCQSTIREFFRDGSVRLEVKDMAITPLGGDLFLHEDSREGRSFSVSETATYLLFTISRAPDHMDGITSRSGFDGQGFATLSIAEGSKVFRIECRK